MSSATSWLLSNSTSLGLVLLVIAVMWLFRELLKVRAKVSKIEPWFDPDSDYTDLQRGRTLPGRVADLENRHRGDT